ncbi:hypothetical protein BDP81DRAFT_465943 [Colletotrichum phormii]|uniref:LysM domain-containing protein n=1 Tax=Colletotrichum phormii TaxID=359342 RepID=A0AAJ0E8J8_9PEZI|nr:uncharacterized protein BDP81DRAFT_465943 [Colletotrichum phormii]KAK1622666.1 hypothetical protein BDP81DRAFT_465943 [Colletotrichum phormii]
MQITQLRATAVIFSGLVSANAAHSRHAVDCAFSTAASKSDICATFPISWGPNSPAITGLAANFDGFYKVSSDCTNLWLDYCVCVHVPGAATTTQGNTQPTTPSSTGPWPQLSGIVSNCKTFYQVNSDDSCWSIHNGEGITFEQFLSYNTQVDSTCSNLWLGYYDCNGV